jgi:hypothetical protein
MDRLELEKRMRKALGTYTNSLVLKMASNVADVAEEYAQSKAENLPISDVSGFTAADMERAYNEGKADGEVQKDIPFNIKYYR